MSLAKNIQNQAIDDLIRSSYANICKWIPFSEIADVKPSQIDNIHYATRKHKLDNGEVNESMIILSLLGSDEICTPTFASEFKRIYSLSRDYYNGHDSHFRRYSTW